MTTPEQVEFIRHQLAAGVSRADITRALTGTGWAAHDIDEAFAQAMPKPMVPQMSTFTAAAPVASPISAATPIGQVASHPASVTTASPRHPRTLWIIAGAALFAILCGVATYAYIEKLWPFAHLPYTQDNLVSGLLASSAKIMTSSYGFSATLAVGPRDADAVPFIPKVANDAQLAAQYKNDATRASDVSTLLNLISPPYPATLEKVAVAAAARSSYYKNLPIKDPSTGENYGYAVTEGGKNFSLSVTFETKDAVNAVRDSFEFSSTTTLVSGQTVTFTKDSSSYLSVSSEPPKPFLVQLGEMMQGIPAEISISSSVAATADWSKADQSNWKFNVDGTGDFGDLSFTVDADALKTGSDYYFRINKIPSILGDFTSVKGQWVKVSPTSASSTAVSDSGSTIAFVASQLPDAEKQYKESRAQAVDALKKIAGFADATHLLLFKSAPISEKIDGRVLYRYDVRFNKDAVLPFYKMMADEAANNTFMRDSGLFNDTGMVDYLESDAFTQVFDYYDKNTTLTLWVDPAGYPAVATYTIRIVPPDTATPLIKKQINVTWKLTVSDINKPVDITAPADAKTIEDVLSGAGDSVIGASLAAARAKGADAAVQADLATIRTEAELYYGGTGKNSYGTQAWVSGAATSCMGGMFKDATVAKSLSEADTANGDGKNVSCAASGATFIVGADLATSGWWCVDSTGNAKVEIGSLPTTEPKSKSCP